jgi:hypothetical protein
MAALRNLPRCSKCGCASTFWHVKVQGQWRAGEQTRKRTGKMTLRIPEWPLNCAIASLGRCPALRERRVRLQLLACESAGPMATGRATRKRTVKMIVWPSNGLCVHGHGLLGFGACVAQALRPVSHRTTECGNMLAETVCYGGMTCAPASVNKAISGRSRYTAIWSVRGASFANGLSQDDGNMATCGERGFATAA